MRTLLRVGVSTLVAGLAGCGSDSKPPIDGPPGIDAPPPMVSTVSCDGVTPAVVVTTPGFNFSPSAPTITVGQIVEFTMGPEHNSKSDATPPLWFANFNASTCVKFDSVGTFGFFCVPHRFTGRIIVTSPI